MRRRVQTVYDENTWKKIHFKTSNINEENKLVCKKPFFSTKRERVKKRMQKNEEDPQQLVFEKLALARIHLRRSTFFTSLGQGELKWWISSKCKQALSCDQDFPPPPFTMYEALQYLVNEVNYGICVSRECIWNDFLKSVIHGVERLGNWYWNLTHCDETLVIRKGQKNRPQRFLKDRIILQLVRHACMKNLEKFWTVFISLQLVMWKSVKQNKLNSWYSSFISD